MLRKIFALVVREEAVFLRIVDDEVRGEVEGTFFAVDLYLVAGKRSFEAIGAPSL